VRLLEQLIKVRFFVLATVAIFAATFVAGSVLRQRVLADLILALEPLLLLGWTWAWHTYRKGVIKSFELFEQVAIPAPEILPGRLATFQDELRSLGFKVVGGLESRFPWQGRQRSWAFLDRDGVAVASVTEALALSFTTYWPDGSLVTTSAGVRPVRVERPMVRYRNVAGRPANVYQRHMDESQAFAEAHGEVVALTSAEDIVDRDKAARPFRRDAFATQASSRDSVFTEVVVCALAVLLLALQLVSLVA
jgi:hypothetical protein